MLYHKRNLRFVAGIPCCIPTSSLKLMRVYKVKGACLGTYSEFLVTAPLLISRTEKFLEGQTSVGGRKSLPFSKTNKHTFYKQYIQSQMRLFQGIFLVCLLTTGCRISSLYSCHSGSI